MFALSLLSFVHANASMFPDIDINDSSLTSDTAAKQCAKSFMHAPHKLLLWCEKAYVMGHWESLYYISMYTGDGSRYLDELNTRMNQGDANAINTLAWLYQSGRFVKKDIREAARLYELYLSQESNQVIFLEASTHYELAAIYEKLGMWEKVITHTQYVIDNADREGRIAVAKDLQKQAKKKN
ncbi:hypothetical protein P20495_0622 [Pseudoalteromonas sp. BSi20495]|nr:hypothetical protein P20495_0622 [Pseudoalteromonas sp. BSi20495]